MCFNHHHSLKRLHLRPISSLQLCPDRSMNSSAQPISLHTDVFHQSNRDVLWTAQEKKKNTYRMVTQH